MTKAEILDRAWSARGLPIRYRLGAGGVSPLSPSPASSEGECDCSGYVDWVFRLERHQPRLGFLVTLNGGWMNTDGIWLDSIMPTGFWTRVLIAGVADVLVYPSRRCAAVTKGPAIGHVGIVTKLTKSGARVLHCSASNYRKFGHAIEETPDEVFRKITYTRACRASELA